jgi:Ca2+/Na+ antiporter
MQHQVIHFVCQPRYRSQATGWAEVTLATNAPPFGGGLAVSPNNGTAAVTSFELWADGWADDPEVRRQVEIMMMVMVMMMMMMMVVMMMMMMMMMMMIMVMEVEVVVVVVVDDSGGDVDDGGRWQDYPLRYGFYCTSAGQGGQSLAGAMAMGGWPWRALALGVTTPHYTPYTLLQVCGAVMMMRRRRGRRMRMVMRASKARPQQAPIPWQSPSDVDRSCVRAGHHRHDHDSNKVVHAYRAHCWWACV